MSVTAHVLRVLADLAPEGGSRTRRLAVPVADRARLPLAQLDVLQPPNVEAEMINSYRPVPGPSWLPDEAFDLVARAKLHAGDNPLRLGWLWIVGRGSDGSDVRFPLVSAPVTEAPRGGLLDGRRLIRTGDVELTEVITDPGVRDQLEGAMQFGGGAFSASGASADPVLLQRLDQLVAWAGGAAAAAGFPGAGLVPEPTSSIDVVAEVCLYLAEPEQVPTTIAASLQRWADQDVGGTAFSAIYLGAESSEPPSAEPVESSLVLSPAQRRAVDQARHAPVTVISGPPGTGKSQTIAAIALDAVERGLSVLVGAPSTAAVEALVELMTDVPGPDPVVFGADVRRIDIAERLGQGGGRRYDKHSVEAATERHRAAAGEYDRLARAITDLLAAEKLAAGADLALTLTARQATPRWFAGGDLGEAERLLERARHVGGLFAGYRRDRRLAKLREHAGASTSDLTVLTDSLATARAARIASDLTASGGLDLGPTFDRLVAADEARRVARAELFDRVAHSEARADRAARGTMAAVAAALRAGRVARRHLLAKIDGGDLTRALPLWIGTLRDIDDLLPHSPAMFDLVIIDEGSQVDQIVAAPALVRGRRAVVAGDPKQLRHVSFLADERVQAVLRQHEVDDPQVAGRLDVRRLSAFDLAASVAPVQFLDEHYRSRPHLVDFSARRFYGGRLTVATRHPSNDALDCISVHHVEGARDADGVNEGELDTVIELIQGAAGRGRSVGVVSPFREHVDALEARVLAAIDDAAIDTLALRLGTVHGFQGCERDLLIVTLSLDAESAAGSMRFAAQENLFNVMITRARDEIVVVTSLPSTTTGLIGDYLRHAEAPPHPPTGGAPADALARRVAADLPDGLVRATSYPAGRHTIDLVLGQGDTALGLLFGVHPDGPAAHIDRHLALRRQGWELREVFASRWGERPAELAVELAATTK